jgi:hypothetical protein
VNFSDSHSIPQLSKFVSVENTELGKSHKPMCNKALNSHGVVFEYRTFYCRSRWIATLKTPLGYSRITPLASVDMPLRVGYRVAIA